MPDGTAATAAAVVVAAEKAAAVTAAAVVVAIAETKREIAVMKMASDIAYLLEENTELKVRLDKIDVAANRWKGGFLLVIALGGIVTWFMSVLGGLKKIIM